MICVRVCMRGLCISWLWMLHLQGQTKNWLVWRVRQQGWEPSFIPAEAGRKQPLRESWKGNQGARETENGDIFKSMYSYRMRILDCWKHYCFRLVEPVFTGWQWNICQCLRYQTHYCGVHNDINQPMLLLWLQRPNSQTNELKHACAMSAKQPISFPKWSRTLNPVKKAQNLHWVGLVLRKFTEISLFCLSWCW